MMERRSKLDCPKCETSILEDDVNIVADIAKCRECGNVFTVSDYVPNSGQRPASRGSHSRRDLVVPSGVKFEKSYDGFILSASTRSLSALFIIPFSAVWIGGSLGGIYGSQILSGELNLISSLFGIPFAIGSIFLLAYTAMTVLGKVVVSAKGYDGSVFTGVGPIGWRRNFSWSDIDSVVEDISAVRSSYTAHHVIRLEGRRRISFGYMLSDEVRYFILKQLEDLLRQKR